MRILSGTPFRITATAIAAALGYTPANKAGDTFTGATTVDGVFNATSAVRFAVTTVTGSLTLTNSHYTVLVDSTGGNVTVTLPAAPSPGRVLIIKKISTDSNTVTIGRNGKTLEGAAADLSTAATNRPAYRLQADVSGNWWIA